MRKIKREDTVLVLTGKDRGKTGVVRQIIGGGDLVKRKGTRPKIKEDQVFVTGLNISKRHQRTQPVVFGNVAGRRADPGKDRLHVRDNGKQVFPVADLVLHVGPDHQVRHRRPHLLSGAGAEALGLGPEVVRSGGTRLQQARRRR
jgi:ribosomal protein L24